MSGVIAFFTAGWLRWLVGGLVFALLVFALRTHWVQEGREQILREGATAAVKIVVKQGAVTERVVTEYIKVAGETKTKTEYIEKEVNRYEKSGLDQCLLSSSFVGLHDSAALGRIPSAAGSIDGSTSGIKAAEALGTVTGNYATYHEVADRLKALQRWVDEQQKVK